MIDEKRVLALIPARGGSKGIKDKNIVNICDRPLIAYTIDAAKNSTYVDDIIVSTDSEDIKRVAEKYGAKVPFMRPDEIATDTATTLDVVLHAIHAIEGECCKYDILVLLQATSPLRTSKDVDGAIEKFINSGCRSLAAVSPVVDSPILIRTIIDELHMEKLLPVSSTVRRQDMPQFYKVNGSIYINLLSDINEKTSFNDNEVPYIMPKNHAVDIDEYIDIEIVKYYMKNVT